MRHVLVCEAGTAFLYCSPWESWVKSHRDRDVWIHTSFKTKRKATADTTHFQVCLVRKQPNFESSTIYLLSYYTQKRIKNMAYSIPPWIVLQDVWIGQSSGVKITGRVGVVQEKSDTFFTAVEWTSLNRRDGGCEYANHWEQLALYCFHQRKSNMAQTTSAAHHETNLKKELKNKMYLRIIFVWHVKH